jgi:hypothetical protein
MPLRARIREKVACLSAKHVVAGSIERLVDPVAQELRPEMTNTPFAKQACMLGISEQAAGDERIGDDPPHSWHLPYRAGETTQCQ